MRIWKPLTRVVISLLALGLALFTAYGLYRLLVNYWYPVLVGLYGLGALLIMAIVVVGTFYTPKFDSPYGRDFLVPRVLEASRETTRFQRLRKIADELLTALSGALVWPTTVVWIVIYTRRFFGERKTSAILATTAYEGLYPQVFQETLIWLAAVAALYAAHFVFPLPDTFGSTLLLILAMYCTAKCMLYTISPVSLPTQLRRGPRNPYIAFIVIAVATYLILSLSFAGLIHGVPNVGLPQLRELTMDMLKFRKAYALVQGETLRPIDYFITIAGFLYYISTLTTFLKFKEFRRADEDHMAVAQAFLVLGKFNDALNWVRKVKAPNAISYAVQAHALTGLNQIPKGRDSMRKSLLIQSDDEVVGDDKVWYTLMAGAIVYPIPEPQVIEALVPPLGLRPKEALLAELIDGLMTHSRLTFYGYADFLGRINAEQDYPLVYAQSDLYFGESTEEVRERLREMPPREGIDEILRRHLILRTQVLAETNSEEDAAFMESWLDENLHAVFETARTLTDAQEIFQAASQLQLTTIWAQRLGSARVEELQFQLEELKKSIKTPDALRKFAALTAQTQRGVPEWGVVKRKTRGK